jgi:hypothetical protein
MTEADWLACRYPSSVIYGLRDAGHERKLLLFACACCRRIAHLMPDERSLRALEFAERFADAGLSGRRGRPAVRDAAQAALTHAIAFVRRSADSATFTQRKIGENAAHAACLLVAQDAATAAYAVSEAAAAAAGHVALAAATVAAGDPARAVYDAGRRREYDEQLRLLHDVFGNPFRPVDCKPAWRTAAVAGLAAAIDQERAFERLPILGDALDDAGCDDGTILDHCRGGGPHVRGCWLLDLLLGRKERHDRG